MPSLPKRLSCWLSAWEKPPPLARSRLAPKAVPLPSRLEPLDPADRPEPPDPPGWSADPPLVVDPVEALVVLDVVDVGEDEVALDDGVPAASVVVVLVPPDELRSEPAELTSRSSLLRTPSPMPRP